MSRLDDIEARLEGAVYSDYGPDPTADLEYLLRVARAAEAYQAAMDDEDAASDDRVQETWDALHAALGEKP